MFVFFILNYSIVSLHKNSREINIIFRFVLYISVLILVENPELMNLKMVNEGILHTHTAACIHGVLGLLGCFLS